MKKLFLRWVFRRPRRLHLIAALMKWYQRSGVQRLVQRSGLLKIVFPKFHQLQFLAPTISDRPASTLLPDRISSHGATQYRVGFLAGCIMDVAFADVHIDTIELLRHHGCEVIIPHRQVCCGSLQAHHGDRMVARDLARIEIEAFSDESFDAIIMNSAGCGAFLKEYGQLFQDDPTIAAKARRVSEKVQDITEFLSITGLNISSTSGTRGGPFAGKRVTYHDPCHLIHTQKIGRQPRDLINAVPGIEYVELPESTWCCGSAGIYNIVRYDDSMKLLHRKIENVKRVQPDIIVTGNPGCLLQLQYGLEREGLSIELLHTATFLRRACGA
jgi:glycolate oxidase iron-sulfur subunit